IYQSGVLFLGYSFGLPVLVADVGSLKDEIAEGRTGYTFHPEDPDDLANSVQTYFASNLYRELTDRRRGIKEYAEQHHSWDVVGQKTVEIYAGLVSLPGNSISSEASDKPQTAGSRVLP